VLDCARETEWRFTIDMGCPRFDWQQIPLSRPADPKAVELTCGPIGGKILKNPSVANMGNPHAIFWVEDVEAYDLTAFGPKLEHDPIFPQKANISLAHVVSSDHIVLKVWERGVGLTQACGSAACATAVSAARNGATGRTVRVSLPGGDLVIGWRADDHVMMTGPVELEFEGTFAPALFADEMV
jgi:diaminopimelate epimerase